MSNEAPDSASLLEELRNSQAAVASEVAAFRAHLFLLNEAITAIAAVLNGAQQAAAEIVVEKLAALNAIQVKLQEAVSALAATSRKVHASDPFSDPRRKGF